MSEQETIHDPTGQAPDASYEYPIMDFCVFDCAVNVFRSLIGEVGASKVLETTKGYTMVWGTNAVSMAKQRFGLVGSELEDVALTYYLLHWGTSYGHIKPLEIRDGNAVVEFYACPTKQISNCPPEVCVALSHHISEGICQATNPEYEFVFTHHIANNDGLCRYVVKEKSRNVDLNNPGSLQRSIPLDLNVDDVRMIAGGVCYASLNIFTMASVDLIGSERTLMLALPQAKETGRKVGKSLMGGSEGKGSILTIGEKLDILGSTWGHIGAPARLNGPVLEKEITECPCKGSPIEVCKQFEALASGLCETINPDYEFALDRKMSEGESSCHWTVRKKVIEKEARQQELMRDDSLGY